MGKSDKSAAQDEPAAPVEKKLGEIEVALAIKDELESFFHDGEQLHLSADQIDMFVRNVLGRLAKVPAE